MDNKLDINVNVAYATKMKKENLYTIGEVAKKTDVSKRMIRYYEKLGFLVDVKRSDNGYRLYNNEHIRVISKIPEFLLLGFSLNEILLAWKIKQLFLTKQQPVNHIRTLFKNQEELELEKLKDKMKRILETHQKYVRYLERVARYVDRIKQ